MLRNLKKTLLLLVATHKNVVVLSVVFVVGFLAMTASAPRALADVEIFATVNSNVFTLIPGTYPILNSPYNSGSQLYKTTYSVPGNNCLACTSPDPIGSALNYGSAGNNLETMRVNAGLSGDGTYFLVAHINDGTTNETYYLEFTRSGGVWDSPGNTPLTVVVEQITPLPGTVSTSTMVQFKATYFAPPSPGYERACITIERQNNTFDFGGASLLPSCNEFVSSTLSLRTIEFWRVLTPNLSYTWNVCIMGTNVQSICGADITFAVVSRPAVASFIPPISDDEATSSLIGRFSSVVDVFDITEKWPFTWVFTTYLILDNLGDLSTTTLQTFEPAEIDYADLDLMVWEYLPDNRNATTASGTPLYAYSFFSTTTLATVADLPGMGLLYQIAQFILWASFGLVIIKEGQRLVNRFNFT